MTNRLTLLKKILLVGLFIILTVKTKTIADDIRNIDNIVKLMILESN